MYKTLKKNIKTLIPKSFLFKNELKFRYFHGLLYIGNKHKCNICNRKLRSFISIESGDLLCPFCGSLSRNRRLRHILKDDDALHGDVLHFSPSRSIYRHLKSLGTIAYCSSDFEDEFLADYQFDITHIKQPDAKFDLVICYHVLEHVDNDIKAMSELYRVLKPNGNIYIQTPYKGGDIYENEAIKTPEERLKHFGQEDHVRIYSVEGLKTRLEHPGFKVEVIDYQETEVGHYYGFRSPETVFKLTK